MEKIEFIGYRRSDLTTKRGEVLYGFNLYFKLPLENGGTGCYGSYKFVSDDRIKSLGGLPPLDVPCVVSFDRYGMFTSIEDPLPITHLKTLCEYYGVSADYVLGLPEGLSWPRRNQREQLT